MAGKADRAGAPGLNVTVSELGERRLLARIRARLEATVAQSADLVIGIGDDAAVVAVRRNALTVLTTDAQIEEVHFERGFSSPADIGYRALAVNLSDLAAMGARPRWALLSLSMPGDFPVSDVDGIVEGLSDLGHAYGVAVIGGNLATSPGPLIVDVTAVGETSPRRVLSRSGARPGDELFVSGTIGGAAAGLQLLRESRLSADPGLSTGIQCVEKYRRPEPRVRLGIAVAQAKAARATIDLSDGLADAVHQLAEASECGVEIDATALPIDPGARAWWDARGVDAVAAALTGGDDYELLLAVAPSARGRLRHAQRRVAEPPLTRIGVMTKDRSMRVLVRGGRRETLPGGFAHWS